MPGPFLCFPFSDGRSHDQPPAEKAIVELEAIDQAMKVDLS